MLAPYTDYGPSRTRGTIVSQRYVNRPYCEMCGPFRGRFLRRSGADEFGTLHRCRSCDEEY
jgi:hypothetical protein